MAYLPAQFAFFQTGAGANFDLQGTWQKLSVLAEAPWSEQVDELAAIALGPNNIVSPLLDLISNAEQFLETGTDGDVPDIGSTTEAIATGLFDQALTFGNTIIDYDFYSLL